MLRRADGVIQDVKIDYLRITVLEYPSSEWHISASFLGFISTREKALQESSRAPPGLFFEIVYASRVAELEHRDEA